MQAKVDETECLLFAWCHRRYPIRRNSEIPPCARNAPGEHGAAKPR